MLSHKIFPPETFPALKYVVIFSRYNGQWLFSRHRQRNFVLRRQAFSTIIEATKCAQEKGCPR